MVDIVSVLSLQARARKNARRSMWLLQRQRAERAEAARVLAAATEAAANGASPVGARLERTS